MGKSSAEIDRGPPQGAAEVSAKLPPAALESTLHVSCMRRTRTRRSRSRRTRSSRRTRRWRTRRRTRSSIRSRR